MNPSIFNFNEHGVRIVLDANEQPLFCLADVCNALGMQRANPSRFNLNPKGTHSLCTPTTSGNQFITFISEENLYRIVFRSTKPEALSFQNWVFQEVLPSIRKTGSYSARQIAYEEFNHLCMQEKVSKDKATFHSHGMHKRKREKHLNAVRIETCKANLQLAFEGVTA